MKEILFATGNARKIAEATKVLGEFDIKVESVKLEMDEIQHHDPAEITKAKARAAYEVAHKPVVVSDTSWGIPALGGFPGGYMKDIAAWLDVQDWLALMARHSDKTIYCYEHVAYFDGEELRHFEHTYTGYFIDEPRIQSPENFVPVGLGARALETIGVKSAGYMARFFAGAVDASIVNSVSDAAIQQIEIAHGQRDNFDGGELAASVALEGPSIGV
jgi:non-canonical purine NTP pyrophosphatase (RdgB/HAM1 family)